MSFAEMVGKLGERLGCEPEAEADGTYTIEVAAGEDRVVLITVYEDTMEEGHTEGQDVIVLRAAAADLDDQIDLRPMLEEASSTWYARIYVDIEEEPPVLVTEAALPMKNLSLDHAAYAVQEVADLAAAVEWMTEEAGEEPE